VSAWNFGQLAARYRAIPKVGEKDRGPDQRRATTDNMGRCWRCAEDQRKCRRAVPLGVV
jgi:hypothetical protein